MQHGIQIRTQSSVGLAGAGHLTGNRRTSRLNRSDVRPSSFAMPYLFPLCERENGISFFNNVLIVGRSTDFCWTSFFTYQTSDIPRRNVSPAVVEQSTDHELSIHRPWVVNPPTMSCQSTDHELSIHRPWVVNPPTMGCQSTDHGLRAHRPWVASTPTMGCEHTDHGASTRFGRSTYLLYGM